MPVLKLPEFQDAFTKRELLFLQLVGQKDVKLAQAKPGVKARIIKLTDVWLTYARQEYMKIHDSFPSRWRKLSNEYHPAVVLQYYQANCPADLAEQHLKMERKKYQFAAIEGVQK